MPEKDYVHTIYIIGLILFVAPWINGFLFSIAMSGAPNYAYLSQGEFYTNGLFQMTAIIMILYVAYKRFMEGWLAGKKISVITK
jgi:hypothetical protein